ncbi:hypothetical protein GCM10027594_29710 [Hymenobacter agri]
MLLDTLRQLFARDLLRLQEELEAYHDEARIWHTEKGIANSAGNLCLHLVGNLSTYISAELGGVPYVRDRPAEFSRKYIPRAELIGMLARVRTEVDRTLGSLPATSLPNDYPVPVFDQPMTTEYFLVHLATHLAYHLGQVNYHRRLLDGPA